MSGSCLPLLNGAVFICISRNANCYLYLIFWTPPCLPWQSAAQAARLGERRVLRHEMAGLAGSEEMQCSAKEDEDVSGLQTSLACACRNRLGYAHLWIAETDLQLPECICHNGTSDYFSLKEIKK